MAKILSTDEMLEALQRRDHPDAPDLVRQLEALASIIAVKLAAEIGATVGKMGAMFEAGYGGTCAAFNPGTATKWPDDLGDLDEGGDFDQAQDEFRETPSPRIVFDWSGPDEGDEGDESVWITTEFGDEIEEVDAGFGVERNKEIARELVEKINALPQPLEDGIIVKMVAEAVAAT